MPSDWGSVDSGQWAGEAGVRTGEAGVRTVGWSEDWRGWSEDWRGWSEDWLHDGRAREVTGARSKPTLKLGIVFNEFALQGPSRKRFFYNFCIINNFLNT